MFFLPKWDSKFPSAMLFLFCGEKAFLARKNVLFIDSPVNSRTWKDWKPYPVQRHIPIYPPPFDSQKDLQCNIKQKGKTYFDLQVLRNRKVLLCRQCILKDRELTKDDSVTFYWRCFCYIQPSVLWMDFNNIHVLQFLYEF